MFDWYRPIAEFKCPICELRLQEWQGKDGPNALFVWQEGIMAPIGQLVDEEVALPLLQRARARLPERFEIYSYDCPRHQPIFARCEAPDGVWTRTVLRPGEQ
jgi:hypothetical protein